MEIIDIKRKPDCKPTARVKSELERVRQTYAGFKLDMCIDAEHDTKEFMEILEKMIKTSVSISTLRVHGVLRCMRHDGVWYAEI